MVGAPCPVYGVSRIISFAAVDTLLIGWLPTESGSKRITYKNESLDTGVVSNYVLQGKKPVKLEIVLGLDDCFFMIDSRFVISKVTLPDLMDDRSAFDTDDDYFDNEFTIRAGQCRGIIFSLLEELGEHKSEEKDAA